MEKNVSIVCVDRRPYRKIAQENWGLTKEQMRGKHVHHHIAESEGGTNDPSNLYVCSPSFHRWVWHNGEEFIEWANVGAEKAHEVRDEFGRSVLGVENAKRLHEEKDDDGKSVVAMKCHLHKDASGKSLHALKVAEKLHALKDENGKSTNAVAGGTKGGKSNAVNKTGFCSPEYLSSKECSETRRENGRVSGAKVVANRTGFCSPEWLSSEECLEQRKANGVKTASTLNSEKWQCTVTGKISTAGPLTRYQKKRGIDPSFRVKVEDDVKEIKR
jgi:hypothetical protein